LDVIPGGSSDACLSGFPSLCRAAWGFLSQDLNLGGEQQKQLSPYSSGILATQQSISAQYFRYRSRRGVESPRFLFWVALDEEKKKKRRTRILHFAAEQT
jgi:hypothetical protein